MKRFRLQADGRIVELRDGKEFRSRQNWTRLSPACATFAAVPADPDRASRLGVPVETIRNWEQGKRAPRGPARALLAVIAHSPETVFAALSTEPTPA
jgi:putative transcriptional regulator